MNKKINRLFLFTVVLTSAVFFNSCSKKNLNKEVTLVMAEVNPPETIAGRMDQVFKDKVEKLSKGKIKIDLQMGGTLGSEENVMKLMTAPNSSIQLERISVFSLTAIGCQKSSLLSIPYTFSSREHFWNFANSQEAKEILDEPYQQKKGVKGLFYGEEGFRHFFASTPLKGPEDFKNLKLRVTDDKIMKGLAKGLEAQTVTINFADLYAGFQTGFVEAAEQPVANYLGNMFNRVAPYMILDGHNLGVTEVIITSEAWDSLSEEQQNILLEAGKYAGQYCRKISREAENIAKEELIKEGAVFTPVEDIKPWQEACSEVIKKASSQDPDLYQKILDLGKKGQES